MTFNVWYLVEAFILSALWVPGVHIIFAWLTTLRQKAAKSGSISVTTLKMKLHIFAVCVSLILWCLKWISSKQSRQCFKRQRTNDTQPSCHTNTYYFRHYHNSAIIWIKSSEEDSSLLVCTYNILSVILRCTTEMAGVSHQASAYKKIPETSVKILNFWGLTFTILAFSSGCHWQSTSSRTFIYSNVSFIIHYVLNQIEGMQRSVEDNCGKVEKHNIYIPLFSTFNIC